MQKLLYSLTALLVIFLIIAGGSEYFYTKKAENLLQEKALSSTVYNLDRSNLDMANIQYRGLNTQLRHKSDALQGFYKSDFASNLLINTKLLQTIEHQKELSELKKDISNFNIAAGEWFTQKTIEEDQLQANKENFESAYAALTKQIDFLTSANENDSIERYTIFAVIGGPLLLLTLISMFLYRREQQRIKELLPDITDEQRVAFAVKNTQDFQEVEPVAKASQPVNPGYIDEVTGINNDKGFMHEFHEHKGQGIGNYTAICLFSIDKLDEMEVNFPTEFSESILKKVGFMLALYRHDRDVIGYIAHNKFVIMLSRDEKSSAVNDCELIRKSVEDNKFTTEGGQVLTITISGGFVQKEATQNINEILKKANKVLSMSIQHGGNRIAQLRDKSTALK